MNKILPILIAAIIPVGLIAQTYSPRPPMVLMEDVGNAYSQDVSVAIPTSVDINLSLIRVTNSTNSSGLPGYNECYYHNSFC